MNSNTAEYHREWYHSNKHRTAESRRQPNGDGYRERKEYINRKKLEAGCCKDCGLKVTCETFPVFEWDHVDPSTKSFNLGNVRGQSYYKIDAELEKCELVCANCHRMRTVAGERWKRADSTQTDSFTLELFWSETVVQGGPKW